MSRNGPPSTTYPPVIGVPGGGLVDAAWAANAGVAAAGAAGERKTAEVLNRVARAGGPTVLHDLMLPMDAAINVDHVVVSGRAVTLIDSKHWAPGFLWTFHGRTRRGWTLFPAADKRSSQMAAQSIQTHLDRAGVGAKVRKPLLVVWSTRPDQRLSVRWLRPLGASATSGPGLARRTAKFGHQAADPAVVAALVPLVVSVRANAAPIVHLPPGPDRRTGLPVTKPCEPFRSPRDGYDPYLSPGDPGGSI